MLHPTDDHVPERKLLLAASTGGHLAQLVRLAPGLGASSDSLWVTFDTEQSRSLLAGRNVLHVPYIRPRDLRNAVGAFRTLLHAAEVAECAAAYSTGAALAVAALPAARLAGLPTTYIESVSRVEGPSMSGRILYRSGFVQMRTQHPSWAYGRWAVHPSVLTTYSSVPRNIVPESPSLFITLGTIAGFPFHSVIDRILELGLADERTVWQVGDTRPQRPLPGRVFEQVSAVDFARFAQEADVVITHAGVGSVLGLLEMGIFPIAVVRRKARGEHVDDHQAQIAHLMNDRTIGVAVEVEELTADVIAKAAASAVNPSVVA